MNQWDSAIVCLHNASEALSQVNVQNRLPAINVYINLADCYQHQGDYGWAGYHYRKALFLSDSLGVGDKMNYPIYSGLAKLYQELENYSLSDSYFGRQNNIGIKEAIMKSTILLIPEVTIIM